MDLHTIRSRLCARNALVGQPASMADIEATDGWLRGENLPAVPESLRAIYLVMDGFEFNSVVFAPLNEEHCRVDGYSPRGLQSYNNTLSHINRWKWLFFGHSDEDVFGYCDRHKKWVIADRMDLMVYEEYETPDELLCETLISRGV